MGFVIFYQKFWFGKNMKEKIIFMDGRYCLLEYETDIVNSIGNSLAKAKDKLKNLGKDDNFPDFMME